MDEIATYKIGTNGRFANALFQAAVTITYSLDNKKQFVFPDWKYRDWFSLKLPLGEPQIDIRIPIEFHYAPIPDYPNKNVELFNGHGQSYKYFAHRWAEIFIYFTLKKKHHYYIWEKYMHYLRRKNCGIHVRRTDYTTPVNLEYHGVMPVEYYEKGAEQLFGTKNPEDVLFIICSDDIAWCKENFHFQNQVFVEGEEDVIDMFILQYCENLIITNSSFSLFPATINTIKNPNYKVVAPKNWFREKAKHIITKDIYMPSWITI